MKQKKFNGVVIKLLNQNTIVIRSGNHHAAVKSKKMCSPVEVI